MSEAVLRSVFYDVRSGFGSFDATYKAAKAQDPSITKNQVRDFLARQELRQAKKTPARYNTWVPKAPREEFQIDLLDWGLKTKPRYGLVAVDIFTKKLAVVPIADKTTRLTSQALQVVIRRLGMPANVMADLGGEFQSTFAERMRFFGIGLVITRSAPHFVERAIGTLRKMIRERMTALGVPWERVVEPVVDRYNETVHVSTGVSPDAAAAEDPEVTSKLRQRFEEHRKTNMKYPSIAVGDTVKIRIKAGKYSEFKTGFKTWSTQTYVVLGTVSIGNQSAFRLEGHALPVLRHDIHKVAGVEKPPAELVARETAKLPAVAPPRRRLRSKYTPPLPSVLV